MSLRIIFSTPALCIACFFMDVSTALNQVTKPTAFSWPRPVYIRSIGAFFPNEPVANHEIEQHIGAIHSNRSAMIREKILG
jgi:hypothetical protein